MVMPCAVALGRRFGLEVIDAYGATEGGVAVNRDAGTPPSAVGLAPDHVQVVDDDGNERPRAEIDEAALRESFARYGRARFWDL